MNKNEHVCESDFEELETEIETESVVCKLKMIMPWIGVGVFLSGLIIFLVTESNIALGCWFAPFIYYIMYHVIDDIRRFL